MAKILATLENPYDPENEIRHAGKVFLLSQSVLRAASAAASDGSDCSVLADRFLLCLYDLDDGTSIWLELQSRGKFEIPHAAKKLYAGVDANWMDEKKTSRYRDGTLWRLGAPGKPFKHRQQQQRAVSGTELQKIRGLLSQQSLQCLIA